MNRPEIEQSTSKTKFLAGLVGCKKQKKKVAHFALANRTVYIIHTLYNGASYKAELKPIEFFISVQSRAQTLLLVPLKEKNCII